MNEMFAVLGFILAICARAAIILLPVAVIGYIWGRMKNGIHWGWALTMSLILQIILTSPSNKIVIYVTDRYIEATMSFPNVYQELWWQALAVTLITLAAYISRAIVIAVWFGITETRYSKNILWVVATVVLSVGDRIALTGVTTKSFSESQYIWILRIIYIGILAVIAAIMLWIAMRKRKRALKHIVDKLEQQKSNKYERADMVPLHSSSQCSICGAEKRGNAKECWKCGESYTG